MIMILGAILAILLGLWMWGVMKSIDWLKKRVDDLEELIDTDDEVKYDKREPKTGYWIKYDKEYFTAEKLTPVIHSIRECSECHTRIADFCGEMKYCPNCGAKMESEG